MAGTRDPTRIAVRIPEDANHIRIRLEKGWSDYTPPEEYEGPYNVTPKVQEAQTLETRGKLMTEDVTVEEVPVYAVSNDAGGITYYIGK